MLATRVLGPGGRVFEEIESRTELPAGWNLCGAPSGAIGPHDRVYLLTRGKYSQDDKAVRKLNCVA